MQSSLFKFMRRVEEEKKQNRKRLLSNGEEGESSSTNQGNIRDTGPSLKKKTISKLESFRHSKSSSSSSSSYFQNPTTSREIKSVEKTPKCLDSTSRSSSKDIPIATANDQAVDTELQDDVQDVPQSSSETPKGVASNCSKGKSGKSVQYTPLELQYLSIKASHPDAILFVECGYKYRFFGEDAEVASRVLKIGCFHAHNFSTGSIPVYRLNVHLRRLVAAGYKVGVVKQVETAALKAAGENKSGPFERKLVGLYTRSTLIGVDVGEETEGEGGSNGGTYLMCVGEIVRESNARKKGKEVTVGFLVVEPSAGDMVFDEFVDNSDMFSELELRLSHLRPVEILYPSNCSQRLKQALLDWTKYNGSDTEVLRAEELAETWYDYNSAFSAVTGFCGEQRPVTSPDVGVGSPVAARAAEALQVIVNLPPVVISCCGALMKYLRPFGLQDILFVTSNLRPFNIGVHCMRLGTTTLSSLEIFRNLSDGTEKGTLFSVLNHTQTAFGRRLLVNWLLYPLRDISKIRQRQEAVAELSVCELPSLALLKALLHKLPDLERKLCSIYHKKCSPGEFYNLVSVLGHISQKLGSFSEMATNELKSELLISIIREVPQLLSGIEEIADNLCERAAREGNYEKLLTRPELYPEVLQEQKAITDTKQKLQDHRKKFRATLFDHSLDYVTVSGDQYLVEVKKKNLNRVPSDWHRVSSTKQVTRYRPQYVVESLKELTQHREQLLVCVKQAWTSVLTTFSSHYGRYKQAVDKLAMADCLISLSEVAKMPGYVCPEMVEGIEVNITAGRHPVIDLLLDGGQYVANNTKLDESGLRCMVLTGPNMGGKSSYIKQVALICILAQIGSCVPAECVRLGALDGVFTRMGAYDNILSGQSTFMMELQEASSIMHLATSKSLVIIDELGRGTSTHDGAAIAMGTLRHFIECVQSLVLFVTHYPILGSLEEAHPRYVANYHMAYERVEDADEVFDRVVFLYQLERGQAASSYGLNVASLAGLSPEVLRLAHKMSAQLEREVTSRLSKQTIQTLIHLLGPVSQPIHGHLSF